MLRNPNEPLNAAIKYPVTVGEKVAFPSVIAVRDIAYVMDCVKTGIVEGKDIRALIYTLRNVPNSDMVRAMKKELPYFLGSVCKRFRSNATVKFAHFAIFDLDHVRNIEAVKRKATTCPELAYIRYAFHSVIDGVKLIAQFDRPLRFEGDYRELWYYLAYQVEQALRLKVDSAPDWARACFYSYDPQLLVRSGWQPVDTKVAGLAAQWHAMRVKVSEQEIRDELARVERCDGGKDVADGGGTVEQGNGGRSPILHPSGKDAAQGLDPSTASNHAVIPGTRSVTREPVFEIPNQTKTQTAQDDENGQDSKRLDPGSGHPNPPRQAAARLVEDPGGDPGVRDDNASDDFSRARSIVTQLSQLVIPYSDWIKCGHALYSGFGEGGRELWNIFQSNPHYHDTERDLDQHWRSFARVHSVTLASLFYIGGKYGAL